MRGLADGEIVDPDITDFDGFCRKRTGFAQATRERGSGRPTKRERRETDRLHGGPGDDED
jgi:hypothetical protein